MAVYLLHFDRPLDEKFPYGRNVKCYQPNGHYVGYAKDANVRFEQHLCGGGAKVTRMAMLAGIGISMVRVWPDGTTRLESELHAKEDFSWLCPRCNGQVRTPRAASGSIEVTPTIAQLASELERDPGLYYEMRRWLDSQRARMDAVADNMDRLLATGG